jgi:hypothetical protein
MLKKVFRFIVFFVSFFYCGIGYGQNNFIAITSSDFIKGLDNKDFLRGKLTENGFTFVKKIANGNVSDAFFEYWQYKSLLYVDIIYSPGRENIIKVGINESFNGFPDRLIQTFPRKKMEARDEHVSAIKVTPTNKNISYSLIYHRDNDYVKVFIWFEPPFYFFQYNTELSPE